MSIEAINWALNEAPGVPPRLVAVLIGLANHAAPDGTGAFPAQKTLAHYARKTERAVRDDLAALLALDLIVVSKNQGPAAHISADRRPVVYDLRITRKRPATTGTTVPPATGTTVPAGTAVPGGTIVPAAGSSNDHESGQVDATAGSVVPGGTVVPGGSTASNDRNHSSAEPTTNQKNLTTSSSTAAAVDGHSDTKPKAKRTRRTVDEDDPDFVKFWAAYPRRVGKPAAREKYAAAIAAGAHPADILDGAILYNLKRKGQDPQFTAHPATWLHQERWKDEDDRPSVPAGPVARCRLHHLEMPCRSCAADSKAAPDEDWPPREAPDDDPYAEPDF